jgi:hypothetical protein
MRALHISARERRPAYWFGGEGLLGLGRFLAWASWSPRGPFLFLFVLFPFFSSLYLLQNRFKFTQTTSENFLKIHTSFVKQNRQVFKIKTRFLYKTF